MFVTMIACGIQIITKVLEYGYDIVVKRQGQIYLTKVSDYWYDLGDKGQCKNMYTYEVFNTSLDICNLPPPYQLTPF